MPGVGENRRSQQRAARASRALRKDLHDEIFVNGLMGPGGGSLEGEEQHSRIDVSLSLSTLEENYIIAECILLLEVELKLRGSII